MSEEALQAKIDKLTEELSNKTTALERERETRKTATLQASEFKTQAKALEAQVATLQKEHESLSAAANLNEGRAAELQALQAEMTNLKSQTAADLLMAEKHNVPARVRGVLRTDYAAVVAEAGDKAPPFAEWFAAQVQAVTADRTVDPVLAPYVVKPQTQTTTETSQQATGDDAAKAAAEAAAAAGTQQTTETRQTFSDNAARVAPSGAATGAGLAEARKSGGSKAVLEKMGLSVAS